MPELTLDEKLRTAHVTRWQIVNVGRNQSVAEHSFLVQLIAIDFSRKIGYSNHRAGPLNIEKEYHIMRWAMWHDMMEVKTGDINTPVKAKMKAMADGVLEEIEYSFSDEYAVVSKEAGDVVKNIVKLADYAEALNFLSEEGKGRHAEDVRQLLKQQALEHLDKSRRSYMSLKWDVLKPIFEQL